MSGRPLFSLVRTNEVALLLIPPSHLEHRAERGEGHSPTRSGRLTDFGSRVSVQCGLLCVCVCWQCVRGVRKKIRRIIGPSTSSRIREIRLVHFTPHILNFSYPFALHWEGPELGRRTSNTPSSPHCSLSLFSPLSPVNSRT